MSALIKNQSPRDLSWAVAKCVVIDGWHGRTTSLHEAVATAAEWFIPGSLRFDAEARRRVLLFLISHLLGPCLGFTVIGYLYLIDPHAGVALWVPAVAMSAFWIFPFALRLTGHLNLLALLSVQNVSFVVLFLSYYYGGLSSPFLPWLIIMPMLAFFYLGENVRLRDIALGGFVVDIAIFYAVHVMQGAFPSRVPLEALSTVGLLSVFCAGLYVTMMAFYYGRIAVSHSELEREVQRHKQTAVMLVEAKDASEAANRAKSEFLATMSHELRTPLNAVIGFSEVMVKELFGPLGHANYKDYVKDIQDSGSHLLEIINDILDISKAEAGAIELDEGLIDCHVLIASSSRLFRPRLEKSHLALGLRLPKAIPQLRADARMVKQMLLNLLTNAIKFTPPGGRIEIEVAADLRCGLFIGVRDTGIGIAESDLPRVRKPFVQVDSALSRRQEGTGLGLALVEMMMRQHGGTLQLDSVVGKGTTARLLFPAERLIWSGAHEVDPVNEVDGASAPEFDPSEATAPISTEPAEPFEKPRLLVVEDDKDLCDLFRRILERAGFSTSGASNGRQALRHLMTEPVDLVITDMVMPEMDGAELMRVLGKDRPNLPIIAISGVDDFKEYCRISTHLGARIALKKPVGRVDLIGAVNDVLAQRLPARSA